jgi:sugar phosphate isomerase/epimerase
MRVALQLYTVRDACAADLGGTLEATAALGFDGVELFDLHGHEPAAVRSLLDRHGLVACGRHTSIDRIEDDAATLVAECVVLGTDRLVISWMPPPGSADEARATSERILAAAASVAELGARLGFHNHDGELLVLDDGRTLLDRLIDDVAAPLELELDLGWVWYAGADPISLLERVGARAALVHVKDMRRDGGPVFVPLGDGDIDYRLLGPAAERAGVEWLIVEQDEIVGPPLVAVGSSVTALRQLIEVRA